MKKLKITLNFWPVLLVAFLLGLGLAGLATKSKAENLHPQKFISRLK